MGANAATLSWVDASSSETGFEVQRDTNLGIPESGSDRKSCPSGTLNAVGQGTGYSATVHFTDPNANTSCVTPATCYYRVRAINNQAFNGYDTNGILNAPQTLTGQWSNVATLTLIVAPNVQLSPAAVDFGNQAVNVRSAVHALTVTNNGTAPLTGLSFSITGVNSSDFTSNAATACPSTLAVNASCTVGINFTPSARGARSASLVLTNNAPNSPQSVSLTGTGTAPVASVFPTSLDFGLQPNTVGTKKTVTISNNGNASLTTWTITTTGTNASQFVRSGTCSTIAAGATCTLTVTFTPTSSGAKSATLTITTNDPANPTLVIPMSGTGTAVKLTPTTTMVYADRLVNGTTSSLLYATLTNMGPGTLTINSVGLTGANAVDFTMNSACGASLAPLASCQVGVAFSPKSSGAKTAAITFSTSDAGAPTASVALAGTGLLGVLTPSPASLSFTTAYGTTSAPQTITITNTGNSPIAVNTYNFTGANPTEFNVPSKTCTLGALIPIGGQCTFNVAFGGYQISPINQSATLNLNVGQYGANVAIPVSGTLLVPAYTMSSTNLNFGIKTSTQRVPPKP